MSTQFEVDRVAEMISRSFGSVPRPSRITKRVALARDDEWIVDEERWRELYDLDQEQTWQQLSDSEIEEFSSILPWLDGEGFRFYLPAFMLYALRRFPAQGHRAICDIHDVLGLNSELTSELGCDQLRAAQEFESLYRKQT